MLGRLKSLKNSDDNNRNLELVAIIDCRRLVVARSVVVGTDGKVNNFHIL